MKFQKFYFAVALILLVAVSCKKEPENTVSIPKEIPPWEKINSGKETVRDSPSSQVDGYVLVLSDAPEFYTEPGGQLITKSNIKKVLQDCADYDFLPRKNETGWAVNSMVHDYIKYYQIRIFANELCDIMVWAQGGEGAFLTYAQFNDYTKTKAALEPLFIEAIASSKIEPLNYSSARKILMMSKPSGPSFYLINITGKIFPSRLKGKVENFSNHQFVVMENGGVCTLVSSDLKVDALDPDKSIFSNDKENTEGNASLKYADADSDGIPEIITFRPSVGASPASELYGFVDGHYRVIGECHEGDNCSYTFEKKIIVKNSSVDSDQEKNAGNDPRVQKIERFKYNTGKLTLIP